MQKTANDTAPSATDTADAAQKVAEPEPGGKTCTIDAFGGTKLDLKDATVGFSQSEKEASPYRIAETRSIKDEAKKRGVKLLTRWGVSRSAAVSGPRRRTTPALWPSLWRGL